MPLDPKDLGKLQDIVNWGSEAMEHLGDLSEDGFARDRKTYVAVLHCVQIVGEAAWSLSDDFKKKHTQVPWPLIAGMRHRLVHDYGRINPARIYSVLKSDLPAFLQTVQGILDSEQR